jgi:hypothetical protein
LAKPIDTDRRLIAIFAADVAGYSRLMGADEVSTLRDLTQRRAILDGLIASHRGRIANTAGDSVLAEFGSAVDAVQCAVEAQAALAEANAGLSPDHHINFRIGIHVGDVMVKGCLAMASISLHGFKPWPVLVAPVSLAWPTIRSEKSCLLHSLIWAHSRSRTSKSRFGHLP